MKVLTVVTTLFMPISFLAGFFGMNFFVPVGNPGPIDIKWLIIAIALIIASPVGMLWWMRRQGWM